MEPDADKIKARLKKPIVMVGLMGAGKTKIGGILAEALGLPFVDADHEIEAAAGCTISEIFEKQGEPAFRDLERRVIARLLSEDLKVLAPGGGALMNEATAALVKNNSVSVWLNADIDVLVERTSRNTKRPLLQNGNPRDILLGLMEKRYPVYARSDVTVHTDASELGVTLGKVIKALDAYLAAQDTVRA